MARQGPEAKVTEKAKKAATEEYGDRLVWVKYHGNEYARSGVSDLLCCLDGVFVAIEMKAPKYEALPAKAGTELQRLFVGHVLKAGGCAGFAASVEQVMEILAHADEMGTGQMALAYYCDGHFTEVE